MARPRPTRAVRRAAIAVAVAALLVAGACGVPTHSGVIVDGPQVGEQSGLPDGGAAPPGPTSTNPTNFILDYLDAVGSYSGEAAAAAARAFMTADAQKQWNPNSTAPINVVRPIGDPAEDTSADPGTYTLDVQVVGLFYPDTGILVPDANELTLRFVIETGLHQLRFKSVTDGLFMTMTRYGRGLQQYYHEQTIYFWDANRTRLIAEPRYIPSGLSPGQREARIVNWILAGPSPFLDLAVSPPPPGVTLRDFSITTVDGNLVVNLSSGAKELDRDKLKQLVEQIGWSFTPDLLTSPIELQIDNQRQLVMDPFLTDTSKFQAANLAAERSPAVSYAIGDGVVHPLVNSYKQLTGVLASPLNKAVTAAAINSDLRFAAFVRRPAPGGGESLWIVQNGSPAPASPVLTGRSITNPTWVLGPTDPPQLAALVDGAVMLLSYNDDESKWNKQTLRPANASSAPLTSFAVSPEGARIAYTAGGLLFVATIVSQAGRPILSQPAEQINLKPFSANVVAWRSEVGLVVGGRDDETVNGVAVNGTAIEEVNVDGENIALVKSLGFDQDVSELSAFPTVAPIGASATPKSLPVLGQAGNRAFQEYGDGDTEVSWSDDGDTVAPAPGSSGPHKLSAPVNPFYAQ